MRASVVLGLIWVIVSGCAPSKAASGSCAEASGDSQSPSPTGPTCKGSSDCRNGLTCLYPVGSCSAAGTCLDRNSLGATCGHVVSYCACDGTTVGGLCGPNYAFGPTMGGNAPCPPIPVVTAGATLTTLASFPQADPQSIAVDSSVYVAAISVGTILKVPIRGGAPVTLACGQDEPSGIAVDSKVFTGRTKGGEVMSVPVSGGTPTTLASGQAAPFAIAVDGTNVYWANPLAIWG